MKETKIKQILQAIYILCFSSTIVLGIVLLISLFIDKPDPKKQMSIIVDGRFLQVKRCSIRNGVLYYTGKDESKAQVAGLPISCLEVKK